MRRILLGLLCFLIIVGSANAIELRCYPNEYNSTSITYTMNGSEVFYTNSTEFKDRTWFSYSSGTLKVNIKAQDAVGGPYLISILSDRTYSQADGNYTTYHTQSGIHIGDISLQIINRPSEPKNETEELQTIKISLMGIATRGKMAIVRTTDEDGKSIIATVSITDPEGNAQIIETNTPVKGFGTFRIAEDSDVPITLIAFAEGYESGTAAINELKGEKLSKEEEPKTTLEIQNVPEEIIINNYINASPVIDVNTGDLVSGATVTISKPNGGTITTSSDANGLWKLYTGELGNYVIKASKEGYIDSVEYTIKCRIPRTPLEIRLIRNNRFITSTSGLLQVFKGEIIEVGLYDPATSGVADLTMPGEIIVNGQSSPMQFDYGQTAFAVNSIGQYEIRFPRSDAYLPVSIVFGAIESFDWTLPVIGVIVLLFVVGVVVVIRRRRTREILVKEPEETEAEPQELTFIE